MRSLKASLSEAHFRFDLPDAKLDILTDSYLTWRTHAIQKIQFSGVAEASFDCDIREKFYKDLLLEDFAKCIGELYEKMEIVYGESKT